MKPRHPIKRTLLVLGLFIVGGAIINVAVAWGCAFASTIDSESRLQSDAAAGLWSDARGTPGFERYSGGNKLGRGLRLTTIAATRGDSETPHFDTGGLYLLTAGWPMLAVTGEKRIATAGPTGLSITHAWSVRCPRKVMWIEAAAPDRLLPWRPLCPGFAINTIFYAAILWLLLAFPFKLRRWRRLKRGLCPTCAYPVGTSPVCTECGKPVSDQSVGRARA